MKVSILVALAFIFLSCDKMENRAWKWCIVDLDHNMCNYKKGTKPDVPISEMDGYWALTEEERLQIELYIIELEEQTKE